jgi:acetyl-CoA synthase
VPYGPAFEGERIRKEEMYLEAGGQRTPSFELCMMKPMDQVEDGKIEVIGGEIDDFPPGSQIPLGIIVEVAGREMQPDFEPILERQIHSMINGASGIFHMGQRDINWLRISKEAKEKGFKLSHLGTILHAKLHEEYGKILDKIQVKIYIEEEKVVALREKARQIFRQRDERLGSLTDEKVDVFYTCTLCQSFAPTHCCIIMPERSGLCGAYNWLDGKAAYQINPSGCNQPVEKGEVIDPVKGQWKGVNEAIFKASRKNLEIFNNYSIMEYPPTSCGCFECISVVLPLANGVMTVNREFSGMTPCGMKFSTLAGSVGGGQQTPGFVGHSKLYLGSRKFILAEGGIKRLVWMPKILKQELKDLLTKRGKEEGIENLLELIADETIAETEEQVMEHLQKVNHPALTLPPLM